MQSLRNTDPAAFASYMAAKYPAAPKTVAEDAIEGADAYLNNAVLRSVLPMTHFGRQRFLSLCVS